MKLSRLCNRRAVLLPAAFLCLALSDAAVSQDGPDVLPGTAETTDLWFVELQGLPLAAGGKKQQVQRDKANFRSAAAKAGIAFEERYAYDTLWNGLSIRIDPTQTSTLSLLPGVKAVYPVAVVEAPEPGGPGPELATALAMTGADFAQSDLGLSGAGVRVAVMDTGVDYDHPDLGGCFGPGCRVETGWDFVGEFFTGLNDPVPDADPDDCETPGAPVPEGLTFGGGHGTHVAGIVGANAADENGLTGVAPGVTFGAYRVFGCAGFTTADIMIAAMEMALADGMDILNMSIGSSYQWPQYPTAAASNTLVNAGMTVVASIGNAGATGVYSASAPGVGEKVIGVASVDNTNFDVPFFTVDGQDIGYSQMSGSPPAPTSGTEEIVFVGRACTVTEGDVLEADPNGKIALAVRGACTFREKAEAAIAAGATAVAIHNSSPGLFFGTVGDPALGTPVVGISQADGLFIRSLEPVNLTWQEGLITVVNPTGGLISSFSSYGLAPDLSLKPDISAPGGIIRSTYPLELGTYATLSGTSMASPHVAGSAALLLEASPNTASQVAGTILQNSAAPFPWWGNPGLGFLDNVHRQGAGLVDIPAAILSMTKIEPGKLSLGESEAGPSMRTLTIENNGPDDVSYTLAHTPALSTGGNTFVPGFFTGFAAAAFSENPVLVPAGGSTSVDVTITANAGLPDLGQYGGYITFSGDDGSFHLVPYAGFKGDYQDIQVIVPIFGGLVPGLGVQTAPGSFGVVGPGAVFDMTDEFNIPFFLVHFEHQSRRLRIEILDANSGRSFQRAAEFQYVGRNATPTTFFTIPFSGVTFRGVDANEVPDGDYVMQVSVQKALGDDDNPDHWETFTTVPFTIDRP